MTSQPEDTTALWQVGKDLLKRQLWEQARVIYEYLEPDCGRDPRFLDELGVICGSLGQPERAETFALKAVAQAPDKATYHANLGGHLAAQDKLSDAERAFRACLALEPVHANAVSALGLTLLRAGRTAEAWPFYLREKARSILGPLNALDREWNGEPLGGKRLLVLSEQGVGEEILTARLYREVDEGCALTIACDPRLVALFARSFPGASFVASDAPELERALQRADFVTHLSKLWATFATGGEPTSDAPRGGFLLPDPARVRELRARYRANYGERRLVGISWGTIGKFKPDARTVDLAKWKAVTQTSDATFISLQYGASPKELQRLRSTLEIELECDPTVDSMNDLDGLAAQMAALDLVISIDNTTLHLAGAIGTPAWGLLIDHPYWLWGRKGGKSAWYPSVRLFRRSPGGGWDPVMKQVCGALQSTNAPRTVNIPYRGKLRRQRGAA